MSSAETELSTLLDLLKLASNLQASKDRECRLQVHPYMNLLQLKLEDLQDAIASSDLKIDVECDSEIQSTSGQTVDPRIRHATLVCKLLSRFAELISDDETNETLLPVSAIDELVKIISVLKLITLVPSTINGLNKSTEWSGKLVELWPPFSDESVRINAIEQFLTTFVTLSRTHPMLKQLMVTRFFGDFLIGTEHLRHYDESKVNVYDEYVENSFSSVVVCRQLFQLIQTTSTIVKGPNAWLQKSLNFRLSKRANQPEGARALLNAVDELGNDNFWTNANACESFAKLLLSVCNRINFFKVVRTLSLNVQFGQKLSLLLASLIELTDNLPPPKASPVQIVFVDFITRPFEMIWNNKLEFFELHNDFGYWDSNLDGSLWLAELWLQHSAKLKHLKIVDRLDKLFGVCMLLNGQLCEVNGEQKKKFRSFPTAIENVIHGVLLSTNNLLKTSEYLVDTLLAMTSADIPNFLLTTSAVNLVQVVDSDNTMKQKPSRHFDTVRLNVKTNEKVELTTLIDLFVNSLLETVDKVYEKERSKFMVNLLAVCMKKWATFNEQAEWSLSNSKWSSEVSRNENNSNPETSRLVMEYFMGSFERLFDNSLDKLDDDLLLKLMEISEIMITQSTLDLETQFAEISQFDLSSRSNEIMETRTKTVHLALSFCGLAMFECQKSEMVTKQFKKLVVAIENFVSVVDAHPEFDLESLKEVRDFAQQTLTICLDVFELGDEHNKPVVKETGVKKKITAKELLDVVRSDFTDEMDGSVEIAERGHAIISIERLLRKRDESIFAEVEDGLTKVFDCLTENLRHFDSYVYLATINALVELTSWKHATFLPKMMFLFNITEVDNQDSDDEEVEKLPKDKIATKARCKVQLGEALAKVAVELGDLAPFYFDKLPLFFLLNVQNDDPIVCASSLSGLASLVVACRGRKFVKNIHEIIRCCASKLDKNVDPIIRRASAHLLRSILVSCRTEMFSELKDSIAEITSLLRRLRSQDSDPVIRLHSDLALIEAETALKSLLIDDPLEKNTRVLNL
ncbi:RTP1-C1 domain-containing protein [Aphelenchoides besseyi]|nr:RTP1-C1 domain-containing protein [Aphelenchoides besseyi]